MRIRSRLILLVAAVLLPALAVAALGLVYIYREEQDFSRAIIRNTAHALALGLDREMARREAILQTLAQSPSLQRGELERFHAYAAGIAQQNDWAIILSDLEGRQLVNTRIPYGKPLPRMLQAEREDRARLGNEVTIISDVYLPPAGLGPHSFAIQVPVRREGQVVQFLTVGSFVSQLQRLLGEQTLPPGWFATIVDRRGVVAARSLEPQSFVGKPIREDMAATVLTQTEGLYQGMSLAGNPSVGVFSRAPRSGWTFVIVAPAGYLQEPARRATMVLAAVCLLVLGLGLAAAIAVARRIARPVETLRQAAERLGHNEPVEARTLGTDELDAVAAAMAQASERLRGATAELERRVAEAVASYQASQRALVQAQKLEALGRLTGGIAHDFNNVLQTLSTGLEALAMRAAPRDRDFIARCQRAVGRGTELARQLMAFARVQEARTETLDLAARLPESRALFTGALPSNVKLDFDLAAGLWPVTVDPAQLELALLNLVINARDAMPRGGRMVLRARNEALPEARGELAAGDYVVVSLADTGEGMSEEVMARALDPFFTTKAVGKGSGMGLPQAYGFARQNSGTLTLESRSGSGTTVTIYLPRSHAPLTASAPAPASRGVPRGTGRVLLVEDDAEVRETVASGLQTAGFEIDTAATGDEALGRLETARFDAVLTDVVMPGSLSGIDLAERIRARHPRIGVVIATGYSERAVQLPGVRALAKPYDLAQAVEALNAAIRPQ